MRHFMDDMRRLGFQVDHRRAPTFLAACGRMPRSTLMNDWL
jgi:hypothetical protein